MTRLPFYSTSGSLQICSSLLCWGGSLGFWTSPLCRLSRKAEAGEAWLSKWAHLWKQHLFSIETSLGDSSGIILITSTAYFQIVVDDDLVGVVENNINQTSTFFAKYIRPTDWMAFTHASCLSLARSLNAALDLLIKVHSKAKCIKDKSHSSEGIYTGGGTIQKDRVVWNLLQRKQHCRVTACFWRIWKCLLFL